MNREDLQARIQAHVNSPDTVAARIFSGRSYPVTRRKELARDFEELRRSQYYPLCVRVDIRDQIAAGTSDKRAMARLLLEASRGHLRFFLELRGLWASYTHEVSSGVMNELSSNERELVGIPDRFGHDPNRIPREWPRMRIRTQISTLEKLEGHVINLAKGREFEALHWAVFLAPDHPAEARLADWHQDTQELLANPYEFMLKMLSKPYQFTPTKVVSSSELMDWAHDKAARLWRLYGGELSRKYGAGAGGGRPDTGPIVDAILAAKYGTPSHMPGAGASMTGSSVATSAPAAYSSYSGGRDDQPTLEEYETAQRQARESAERLARYYEDQDKKYLRDMQTRRLRGW
jgi:hypothetical protein